MKDPLPVPLFEKSRVVIPVAGFSLSSHRYSHLTPWRSGVGDPDGSSWRNRPYS